MPHKPRILDISKPPAACAAIVSLRFSPAFISHALAYAKLLGRMGYGVLFLLDERYLDCADFESVGSVVRAGAYGRSHAAIDASLAIFLNPAMNNARVARRLRTQGLDVLYLFHEPIPLAERLPMEGWKEIVKLIIARRSSIAMLRQSTAVLVPSACARTLYDRYYARFNANVYTFPLLFDDECTRDDLVERIDGRQYFSFIAAAVKAHGFGEFVDFAKHAIRAGSTIQFSIATRTDLSGLLTRDAELRRYRSEGKISILHGRVLSNEEVNEHCLRSFCVWNAYRCSTQSGVLARAFMAGTPVLATRIGSFADYVIPGMTGEFMSADESWDKVLKKVEAMRDNFPIYFRECRKVFLKAFHYLESWAGLAEIVARMRTESDGSESSRHGRGCEDRPAFEGVVMGTANIASSLSRPVHPIHTPIAKVQSEQAAPEWAQESAAVQARPVLARRALD